ncbi:MAG: hypothetical protein Q8L98_01080 [Chlamydiales bacterium]|nr:hypothetical protein [Chlamydiales bacterium]
MIAYIQNSQPTLFLKNLSNDVSETLKTTDFTQDRVKLRIASIAFRSIGGLIALDAILLAAKTIVVIAAGGWILPHVLVPVTLFGAILAHDFIQTGYNLRPETGFIKALKNSFKDNAQIVFNDTIAFYPLYLAYEKNSH